MLISFLFLLAVLLIFGYMALLVVLYADIICSNINETLKPILISILLATWLYGFFWIVRLAKYLLLLIP